MKRKILSHLITICLAVMMLIIGLASATAPKEVEPDVIWDESLTTGVTRITNDGIIKNTVTVSPDGAKCYILKLPKEITTETGHGISCTCETPEIPSRPH